MQYVFDRYAVLPIATMIERISFWRILEGVLFHFDKKRPMIFLALKQRGIEALVFYDEAVDLYELAVRKSPDYRRAWACRAALLATGGESEEAKRCFETNRCFETTVGLSSPHRA